MDVQHTHARTQTQHGAQASLWTVTAQIAMLYAGSDPLTSSAAVQ
jgi:hypothetical protein